MGEIWVPAPGQEWRLEISNLGRVRTLPTVRYGLRSGVPNIQRKSGRLLQPYLNHAGYPTIALQHAGSRPKFFVHRFVALAFVPGYFDGATVNHIDGDKTNNRADNLEWVSLAQNTVLQWQTGLVNVRGERHPSSKLSDAQVREIKQRLDSGEGQTPLSREYGVSVALVSKIRRGKKPVIALT
jgi:hypothetical protein